MYSLREVKKEIRVLGIAAKNRPDSAIQAVGAVYRGRLYLDGVMKATAEGPDITGEVAEMIEGSPHRPQIRVILLDSALTPEGVRIDPVALSDRLSKPVIALNPDQHTAPDDGRIQHLTYRQGGTETPALSVGLMDRTAARVLRVASREGANPEALRVAGIIVSAFLDKKRNIIFKRT